MITYKPKSGGSFQIQPPKYSQHLKHIALLSGKGDYKNLPQGEQLEIIGTLSEELHKYVVSVEFKEYKTLDEMMCAPECFDIITELTIALLSGFQIEGEAQPS